MVTILVPPADVPAIQAEIDKISSKIRSLDSDVTFFTEQLNGKPEELLFTPEEIELNPSLAAEQQVLFPATMGALTRDLAYYNLLSSQAQPIVMKYEVERRLLDGNYPDFIIPGPLGPGSGVFDENLIQVSGVNSILPLFTPGISTVELANPGQMFGGSALDPANEVTEINNELARITSLLSGACQGFPPVPAPCQTARIALENSLKARFNPIGPSGMLVQQEAALNANPDLALFPSNPLNEVSLEKARIQAFLVALALVPPTGVVPGTLLTANQAAATTRKTYIQSTRIPEMGGFLNTNPGYYGTRFGITGRRVNVGGTAKEIKFLQESIVEAGTQKADLLVQKAFLESLLPV